MPHRHQAEIVVSFGVLVLLACVGPVLAQQYTFTHLAGPGGDRFADGQGRAAHFDQPMGVAVDVSGNVYVADYNNHTIRQITSSGAVTTLAGMAGVSGSSDGTGSAARFNNPAAVAVDGGGNVYVADFGNNTIRKITPARVVTTLAGMAGTSGTTDATGPAARFWGPRGITVDSSGNVYVADYQNYTIRKITAAGVVTTLAGTPGVSGTADGTGPAARFYFPQGMAVDSGGNVYVGDYANNKIRVVTPGGVVTTLATMSWGGPAGLGLDSSGNVYVSSWSGNQIFKVSSSGTVTAFAGSLLLGFQDGAGSAAVFNRPIGVAVDGSGNVYVGDSVNNSIRRVTSTGVVSTIAGTAETKGSADGTGSTAQFSSPQGVAVNATGDVFVADDGNGLIRKITSGGVVTTFAGGAPAPGCCGATADGTGTGAHLDGPGFMTFDGLGNLWFVDWYTIRYVNAAAKVTTFAGSGASFFADGTGTGASFRGPAGIAVAPDGTVYVTDSCTVRTISNSAVVTTIVGSPSFNCDLVDGTGTAARVSGLGLAFDGSGALWINDGGAMRRMTVPANVVTTFVGNNFTGYQDGSGSSAFLHSYGGTAIDAAGNMFIADSANNVIRKITPAGNVTTIAGGLPVAVGSAGKAGNADGTGSAALFNDPVGIAVDASGNLYVADNGNNCIRKGALAISDLATIDAASGKPGVTRSFGTSPATATAWQWSMIRRPTGSTATLSSTTIANPTFTPDVADLYVFRLVASSASGMRISTVSLLAGTNPTGDTNGDGLVSVPDVFYLARWLFAGGQAPVGSGDANGDGVVNAADLFYLINYLYAGGPAPR